MCTSCASTGAWPGRSAVDALQTGQPSPQRPSVPRPPLTDPEQFYYEPVYAKAIEHISELYQGEGYLSVRVGPPELVRIGKDRAEDDRDPTPFNVGARESAQQEIERIEAEALKAGYTPTHPQWPHKQLDALYQRAYGTRNMGAQPFGKGA